ncbi:zf-HC2 domain-containing protein [Dactylosporangium sp. AC04546]|uniref:zf-HC2 domain-containing protein n=1 Tax=Dactylosporangium sp. AC04546 TaxID=2862460 RepID=UPI001EDCE04B|nr:zf-HC2 domain-containing protein [Dactylosporangium sp. AC04546]WVK86680.1 zf-HC2 domain-containing protein [Dactylosporangium sp. AC04546]
MDEWSDDVNVVDGGGHVTSLLGMHALNALDEHEHAIVTAHLSVCAECRAEFDYVKGVPRYLDQLSDEDFAALLPPDLAAAFTAAPASAEPSPPSPPRLSGTADPVSLAEVRQARDTRRRRWAMRSAVAAAVVVVAGGGLWLAGVGRQESPGPVPHKLIAEASGGNLGTSASISVTPRSASVSVSATLRGMTAGQQYNLLVVTGDGQTFTVATFTGAGGGSQVVRGEAPVTADRLGFFTVVKADGGVVVTVPFNSGSTTSQPRPPVPSR